MALMEAKLAFVYFQKHYLKLFRMEIACVKYPVSASFEFISKRKGQKSFTSKMLCEIRFQFGVSGFATNIRSSIEYSREMYFGYLELITLA